LRDNKVNSVFQFPLGDYFWESFIFEEQPVLRQGHAVSNFPMWAKVPLKLINFGACMLDSDSSASRHLFARQTVSQAPIFPRTLS